MKFLAFLIACLLGLLFVGCVQKTIQNSASDPMRVSKSSHAVALAESALQLRYGNEQMLMQRPYNAVLRDSVWIVYGSLPSASEGSMYLGGVAEVRISARTGRILAVTQEE